jgi:hypothetical protein
VNQSMTPQGVEHYSVTGKEVKVIQVNQSMTPQGVEHAIYRDSEIPTRFGEPINDAARR